jgi:flagellar protein FliL
MAKKANEDDETAEDGAEAPKSGKKKLVMIGGAVALVAVLGGGGWFFFMKKKPSEDVTAEQAAAAAKKLITFVEMKDMMIGITAGPQQDRQPIVRIKVALEIADSKTADQVKPLLPRVEDVFMRELRPSDLDGSAGMYRLKEELLRRVNVTVYPAKVDAVLFKELLLQ